MRNPARGHDLVTLRRLNTTVVLRAPSRRSPRTRAEPAAGSSLPQSTVEAAVEEPTGRGLVGESAATGAVGDHPPGRPARRFRFRAEAGLILGVDAGLHKTPMFPAGLGGAALTTQLAQHTQRLRGSSRLDLLRHAMETFLGTHVPRRSAALARRVGVPGVVDAGGVVTSPEVPEWSGADLGRLLSDGGRGRTLVENDVHLAVLAERRQGAATLADDVIGGRPHRGGCGSAGGLAPGVAAPVGRHPVPLLEERLHRVTPHVPRIALSSLGERGVALGAVRKAPDHVEEELLADTAP
ncbi:ROK family transcriptional regulator [Streptomyces sp. NPDC015345]|uniref:ROK family transcriptional regulator n=1 Tax=Streptomyces sp. NPDC015345 TaxID=3364953 RepID=UPI0036F4F636